MLLVRVTFRPPLIPMIYFCFISTWNACAHDEISSQITCIVGDRFKWNNCIFCFVYINIYVFIYRTIRWARSPPPSSAVKSHAFGFAFVSNSNVTYKNARLRTGIGNLLLYFIRAVIRDVSSFSVFSNGNHYFWLGTHSEREYLFVETVTGKFFFFHQ